MRTIEKIERDCKIASGTCFDISDSEIEAAQVRLSQDIPDLLAALEKKECLLNRQAGYVNAQRTEIRVLKIMLARRDEMIHCLNRGHAYNVEDILRYDVEDIALQIHNAILAEKDATDEMGNDEVEQ